MSTLVRTLERLERLGDSDADRALRPPVTEPDQGGVRPRGSWRRRLLVGAVVVVVAAAVVTWLVGWSPLLGAGTVTVRGTTTLTADQVRAAAAVAHGSPLVRLDTAAVAHRVEALPDVAAAAVTVEYPSTVTVTVTERTPVLWLADPTRLVDGTGLAYRTVDTPPAGLPRTDAGGAFVLPAAAVAAALPAAARALVTSVDVDASGSVGLTLADGRTVLWGDTSRAAEKSSLLAALILTPAGGTAPAVAGNTIDLTDPDVVVTR